MASITPHASSADPDDHTHPLHFQAYALDGYYHHENLHQSSAYHPESSAPFEPSLVAETYYQHPPNGFWPTQDQSQTHYAHPPMVDQPGLPFIADHPPTHVHSASDYMSNSTETETGSDGDGDNEPLDDQRASRKRVSRATGSSTSKKLKQSATDNALAHDGSDKPKAKRRPNACTYCQQLKMRCIGADNGPPCDRCRNRGHECTFEKGSRGGNADRKRQKLLDQIHRMEKTVNILAQPGFIPITSNIAPRPPTFLSPPSDACAFSEPSSTNALGLSTIDGSSARTQHEPEPSPSPSPSHTSLENPGVQTRSSNDPDAHVYQHNRLATRLEVTSPNNLDHGKSTRIDYQLIGTPSDINAAVNQLEVGSLNATEDRVRPEVYNIASNEEIIQLFDIYFNHMNTQCGLLEREFHTPSMIRSRSPFLLSTICAIASKFYDAKPELYSELCNITRKLAFSTLERGYKSVEIVQAYLLLTLWPLQGRTWLMLGLAIRIATDMDLHRENVVQPNSSPEVKERRNRERTWLICYILDRGLGVQTGKPYSIIEDGVTRSSGQWWQHSDAIPQDAEVVEHLELQRILSRSLELLSSASENFDYLSVINAMESQLKTWSNQWEHYHSSDTEYRSLVSAFYYHHASMVINLFGLRNAVEFSRVDIPHFLSRCHSSAVACAAIVYDRLVPCGYMRYSPDSHFIITSHVAVTLLKLVRPGFSELLGDGSETISSVQEIADSFERIAINPVHIPARCSTLLRALIKAKQETTGRLAVVGQPGSTASLDQPTAPNSRILRARDSASQLAMSSLHTNGIDYYTRPRVEDNPEHGMPNYAASNPVWPNSFRVF